MAWHHVGRLQSLPMLDQPMDLECLYAPWVEELQWEEQSLDVELLEPQ